jgi:hypothetical protein
VKGKERLDSGNFSRIVLPDAELRITVIPLLIIASPRYSSLFQGEIMSYLRCKKILRRLSAFKRGKKTCMT